MPMRSMKIYCENDSKDALKRKPEIEIYPDGGRSNNCYKKIKHLSKSQRMYLEVSRESQERILHTRFPAFNLYEIPASPSNSDFQKYPSCEFSAPEPIYVSNTRTRFSETCHRRPFAYELWRKRLFFLRSSYMSILRKNPGLKKVKTLGSYHARIYELAEHRHNNPDIYFSGTYDFYYTGGNLASLSSNTPQMNSSLVMHSYGLHLNKFAISDFVQSDSNFRLNAIHTGRCNERKEIFEMRKLNCYDIKYPDMFAIRQLNKITLQEIHHDEIYTPKVTFEEDKINDKDVDLRKICSTPLTEFKCNTPFISFTQTSINSQKFLISNMKQQVRMYDLSFYNPYMTNIYKLSSDDAISYNILRPWMDEIILYANKNFLCPMDLRTEPKEWLNRSVCSDKSTFLDCDMITTCSISNNNSNKVYVATSHKLHCVDIRYMTGHLNGKGSIGIYTHQLENAPKLIDVHAYGDTELVALSSEKANDLCICEFSNEAQTHVHGPSSLKKRIILPYQPSSMEDALRSARQAAYCLNPRSQIKQRLRSCTTGLVFHKTTEGKTLDSDEKSCVPAYLITSNSIGDVIARVAMPRDNQENDYSYFNNDNMDKYSAQIIDNISQSFLCSGVYNLNALRKIFKCDLFSLSKQMKKQVKIDKNKFIHATRGQSWRKPMETLIKYADLLAKDLHSIWDINIERVTTIATIDKKLIEEKNTNFINDWVKQQATISLHSSFPTPVMLSNCEMKSKCNLLIEGIKCEPPECSVSMHEHAMVALPLTYLDENLARIKNKKMFLSKKKEKGF